MAFRCQQVTVRNNNSLNITRVGVVEISARCCTCRFEARIGTKKVRDEATSDAMEPTALQVHIRNTNRRLCADSRSSKPHHSPSLHLWAGWGRRARGLGASHSVQLSASSHGSKTRSITIAQVRREEARRDGLGSRLQERHEIISRTFVRASAWQAKARCHDLAVLATDIDRASRAFLAAGKSPASGMGCV